MTADDVRKLLRKACENAGTAAAWAKKNKISPQYVSDVLSGGREPAGAVLEALGVERVTTYRRIKR